MNRREFTASFAALVASPAVPLTTASAAPVAATTSTSMAYMFADLIARSRGSVDAGFLARRLKLTPDSANQVMADLAANKVIGAPGLGGVAQAVNPLKIQTPLANPTINLSDKMKQLAETLVEDTAELKREAETEILPGENDET